MASHHIKPGKGTVNIDYPQVDRPRIIFSSTKAAKSQQTSAIESLFCRRVNKVLTTEQICKNPPKRECQACIIHCNITPRNILMDDSWIAKISDFGLSKLLYPDEIRTSMALSQSRGHLAPEWQNNASVSVKADIYSFGVVLLEIICCRSSVEADVSAPDEMNLSSWAYQCFVAGQLDKLVEDEDVEVESLERMVKIGLLCVQHDPAVRPLIKNVILMLEGTKDIPTPPSIAPFCISA